MKRKEMLMKKIGITVDCVCDLPEKYLEEHDIGVAFFYITTSTGMFRDGDEITSENILEYLENGGGKSDTHPPSPKEYMAVFVGALERYEEIIHFSLSEKIDSTTHNAKVALELMREKGKRVTVIDSENLSTGMAPMIMNAVEMRDGGSSVAEIAEASEAMKSRISSSYMTPNMDYLFRGSKIQKQIKAVCEFLGIYPVLTLKKGSITLKEFLMGMGNYENAVLRFIRKELKHSDKIDKRRVFITHTGCTVKLLARVREQVDGQCSFEEVIVTKASATIASNCGPGSIGIQFLRKEG